MPFDPGLSRPIDRIRLSLADTDADSEWLPDPTYEALLTSGGASLTVVDAATAGVARTAAGVIAALIRQSPIKRTANGEAVDYTGRAEFYEAIAAGVTPLPLLETGEDATPAARTPDLTLLIGAGALTTEARW